MEKCKLSDLPKIRQELIVKQNGLCPICGKDLTRVATKNLVVDHDHSTGVIRAVLHRGCNGLEGKVLRFLTTWGKAKTKLEVIGTLKRLINFWELYSTPQTDWIYYNHKTAAEKRAAYNAKRRRVKSNAKE
jgi:hypothetical protein